MRYSHRRRGVASIGAVVVVTCVALCTSPAASAQGVVTCEGGSNSCQARVSIGGGASSRQVVIRLSDTDLRLVSVRPNRGSLKGAYSLSREQFREGGSEYAFTLNAIQAAPRGSQLILTFRSTGGGGNTVVTRCTGGVESCRARVSLAGGASNRTVIIQLPGTNFRLASVRPNRNSLIGAYGLSGHRLSLSGSEYRVTLNAVQSIPRGSFLVFRFRLLLLDQT
jgi:hypothetical protein